MPNINTQHELQMHSLNLPAVSSCAFTGSSYMPWPHHGLPWLALVCARAYAATSAAKKASALLLMVKYVVHVTQPDNYFIRRNESDGRDILCPLLCLECATKGRQVAVDKQANVCLPGDAFIPSKVGKITLCILGHFDTYVTIRALSIAMRLTACSVILQNYTYVPGCTPESYHRFHRFHKVLVTLSSTSRSASLCYSPARLST